VLISSAQENALTRPAWVVTQVYPFWQQNEKPLGYGDVAPDIVVAVFPEALNIRNHFPHPKIVAIHAAIHWVESPERFPAQYVFDLITAIRYNVDFILTQNARMAEILDVFYNLLAKWPLSDRIIVSPLGIVEEELRAMPDVASVRREMALGTGDVAVINAGGAWRWTDFNTFLEAFGEHALAQPDTPLRFFVMGLLQPTNIDHNEYCAQSEALLYRFRELMGSHITVYNHWDDAARRVKAYTASSSLGLNVNKPSLENWQSYRLRFLDYMTFGVPVINTRGDLISDSSQAEHAFLVDAGNVRSYREVLDAIATRPDLVAEKAAGMRALARSFDSRNTYGRALDQIDRTPRRPADDHGTWGDCVLDYAGGHIRREFRERLHRGMNRLADALLE
jgi:glycosyltransferase involved in cell wall biosynthesis